MTDIVALTNAIYYRTNLIMSRYFAIFSTRTGLKNNILVIISRYEKIRKNYKLRITWFN